MVMRRKAADSFRCSRLCSGRPTRNRTGVQSWEHFPSNASAGTARAIAAGTSSSLRRGTGATWDHLITHQSMCYLTATLTQAALTPRQVGTVRALRSLGLHRWNKKFS
jgi:hypothetical protein